MPMRRACWSRQTYYPLTRNFLLKSAFETGRFAHHMAGDLFVPMEVVKAGHEHAREWSSKMTGKSLSVFNSALEQRWQQLQNQSQRRGGADLARFQLFVEEEYWSIMGQVVCSMNLDAPVNPGETNVVVPAGAVVDTACPTVTDNTAVSGADQKSIASPAPATPTGLKKEAAQLAIPKYPVSIDGAVFFSSGEASRFISEGYYDGRKRSAASRGIDVDERFGTDAGRPGQTSAT